MNEEIKKRIVEEAFESNNLQHLKEETEKLLESELDEISGGINEDLDPNIAPGTCKCITKARS